MAKDPVCGMTVDERRAAATSTYKGQTYYFCSPGCKAAFDKAPEDYLGGSSGGAAGGDGGHGGHGGDGGHGGHGGPVGGHHHHSGHCC